MGEGLDFPSWFPKVGDVVIIRKIIRPRVIIKARVIERKVDIDVYGQKRTPSILVLVGDGSIRTPQEVVALRYDWLDKSKRWYSFEARYLDEPHKKDDYGYQIRVVPNSSLTGDFLKTGEQHGAPSLRE